MVAHIQKSLQPYPTRKRLPARLTASRVIAQVTFMTRYGTDHAFVPFYCYMESPLDYARVAFLEVWGDDEIPEPFTVKTRVPGITSVEFPEGDYLLIEEMAK